MKRSANCYLPENLSSPLILSEVRITHSLVFWVVLCRLLLVVLSFFFLPLYRLSSCRYIVCLRAVVSSVFLLLYRLSSCRCIVCLLAIVSSVIPWFTTSGYLYDMFRLFLNGSLYLFRLTLYIWVSLSCWCCLVYRYILLKENKIRMK